MAEFYGEPGHSGVLTLRGWEWISERHKVRIQTGQAGDEVHYSMWFTPLSAAAVNIKGPKSTGAESEAV